MKLSEIMAFKNLLDAMTPLPVVASLSSALNPLLNVVSENPHKIQSLNEQLTNEYKNIFGFLRDFENTIEQIKTALQDKIEQNNNLYFEQSLKNYNESLDCETVESILDRKLPVYKEVVDKLITRIRDYNSWQYAALIIRPGREDWIHELVACDPLYLVDINDELLEPARLRFNDQYQRRLRTYCVNETVNSGMFDQLPNGQFGFCLIYNFFNYKPMEIINSYLTELYHKLKPGGTAAFTFNNCDRAEGIELFEKHFMSYTPENNITALCETIGYEIKNVFRLDHSCTWIEIVRPGQLTSLRGGQSLAKVVYKDEYYHYTKEQIESIKQQASDLNIAGSDELTQMPLGQIIQLLNQRTNK
jgi:hypothetical protein